MAGQHDVRVGDGVDGGGRRRRHRAGGYGCDRLSKRLGSHLPRASLPNRCSQIRWTAMAGWSWSMRPWLCASPMDGRAGSKRWTRCHEPGRAGRKRAGQGGSAARLGRRRRCVGRMHLRPLHLKDACSHIINYSQRPYKVIQQ